MSRVRLLAAGTLVTAAVLVPLSAGPAAAHDERPTRTLAGTGHVPAYRPDGPALLVCTTDRADFERRVTSFPADLKAANQQLWDRCSRDGFHTLQAAVDAVTSPGMTIRMLPGVYTEEPSLAAPTGECANLSGLFKSKLYQYDVLSLEQQRRCPHNQNLVAIIDKHDLQIEGTGAAPTDVVVDAQYRRLNTIRADNADGIYFRNLTAERSQFNAFYIMETDGFVVDTAVGRWNDEYGFLTFAVDHGLYTHAEGYGNGDSAFYPGAASNINAGRGFDVPRYAVEIRDSYGHDNMLGYSGTAGDSVWVHDSVFTHNSTGISTDSAFPNHPGMPQNHSRFERNVIADNNHDFYRYFGDGTCSKWYADRGYEKGVVCPVVGVPVGAGVINPGGNYNLWKDNWIYGNRYAGFVTSWVPGFVRGDGGWAAQFDTSNHNRYLGNRMGVSEKGVPSPNGVDYWWDGQGRGSCWTTATGSVSVSSNVGRLPACGADGLPTTAATRRYVGEPVSVLKMYVCATYSLQGGTMPGSCDWWGASGARGWERVEVRFAAGEAVVLTVLLLALKRRRLHRSPAAAAGTALVVLGLATGVAAQWWTRPVVEGTGLALAGIGWLLVGTALSRRGRRGLGGVAVLVGVLALMGAVDHALVLIPLIPVPPSVPRLLLEVVLVLWGMAAMMRRDRPPAAAPSEPAAQAVTDGAVTAPDGRTPTTSI